MNIDIKCENGLSDGIKMYDSEGDTLKGVYTKLQFSKLTLDNPTLEVTMYTYDDILNLDGETSFTEEFLNEFPAIERVRPV